MKYRKISQFILLIAGVSMMSYGAVRGEATVVLSKAIKLCLELPHYLPIYISLIYLREEYIREVQKQYVCQD